MLSIDNPHVLYADYDKGIVPAVNSPDYWIRELRGKHKNDHIQLKLLEKGLHESVGKS